MTEMPSIARIEAATFSAWPAISTAMDGMWLARFARGYTRRSNSIQCLDPQDDGDAAARLDRMVELYLLNDLTPIFRVTPLVGPGVLAALDAGGWQRSEESRVMAMALPAEQIEEPAGLRVSEAIDEIWIEGLAALIGATGRNLEALRQLLNLIAPRNAGILVRDHEGETVGAAMAVNASGIGVYHNVVTRPDRRGQGFGRAAMAGALRWSQSVGAQYGALQVIGDNEAGLGLYTSLGFSEVYRYHYRQPA